MVVTAKTVPAPTPDDLFEAIVARDLSKATSLLDQAPTLLNAQNARQWSALHFACRYGNAPAVSLLLSRGADATLGTSDTPPKTALDLALAFDATECAKLLGWKEKEPLVDARANKYIDETANFFGGSPLNRMSEVRSEEGLLGKEEAKILVLDALKFPMKGKELVWVKREELSGLGQEDETLVFLGADEVGCRIWALDGTNLEPLKKLIAERGGEFKEARPAAFSLAKRDAAILAQARSMVDWNTRYKFCSACGSKTTSKESGHKRFCTNEFCIAHKSVQNFSYPRTDPVVIICIASKDNERCLLGRQKAWPKGMYSCIAGFVEPGETIEEAARREAQEETAIRVGRVIYHSSQPWPMPSQLMFGMVGQALSEEVSLVDKELEDARWFSKAEVLEALTKLPGSASGAELFIPPSYAIAHVLVKAWANGDVEIPKPKI
ncbi:Peroxisomal NADH pyrophosphatase nudt12 [Irineochytrium annulatum]|nr:Peroxisomal NADH pyrophosphatase nudt12 [Irineochytrium annulatum]